MNLTDWARGRGIHPQTAYRWFREGTLPVPAVRVNQRTVLVSPAAPAPEPASHFGLYARVSSHGQKAGLDRQVARLTAWAADAGGQVVQVELIEARERRRQEKARQRRLRDRENMAACLGVQVCAVKERGIGPSEVEGLLAAPPAWLAAEQERWQAQAEREATDRLRRGLTDALVTSVHDAWLQELKRAISDEEAGAIDARWAPEVDRAKGEAQQLAGELTPGQVRARIGREQAAARDAGVYRATRLARRAFGGEHG